MQHNPSQVTDRIADYLKSSGLQVLDRDWNHEEGLIPFVATDRKSSLIVCAMRVYRRNKVSHTLISEKQKRTLRLLAVHWIGAHGMRFDRVRVDLVCYIRDGSDGYTIEHVKGVA